MKTGIIVFPGTNCERETCHAIKVVTGSTPELIYSHSYSNKIFDLLILPGGFSYGDYLRSGAIASKSKIIDILLEHNNKNKLILGICNGFQILTEAFLLPGTLMNNDSNKFICKDANLQIINWRTPFTTVYKNLNKEIKIPIAHRSGKFYCDNKTLKDLKENNQIVFKYANNINGSTDNIAAIVNKKNNILGMMPHPERATCYYHSSMDGFQLFLSILVSTIEKKRK